MEGERLVTNKCLIMTFGIGNVGLALPTVGKHAPQFTEIPVLVAAVLEQLDPVIRNAHRQTVRESNATFIDGPAQPRHA